MTTRPDMNMPRFIVVEGPIGVGKTSLARRLADTFSYQTLLESPEANPFLERFYREGQQHALSTELYFLLQRARQLAELQHDDLFATGTVADFLIDKDQLFAAVNLDEQELHLFEQVYAHLTLAPPTPDLVIYLQAPPPILAQRVQQRGVAAEQDISHAYLEALADAYARHFHFYDACPLLIVNAAEIDLVHDDQQYARLVEVIRQSSGGRQFFNPHPTLI